MNSTIEKYSKKYMDMLVVTGKLSRLYSDSKKPYLHYRIVENAYCIATGANNLSRSDVAIDASLSKTGIGIKTFVYDQASRFEKIAEFNKLSVNYRKLNDRSLIKYISEQRNNRLKFAMNAYGVDNLCYHCVVRQNGLISVFEEPMELVRIESISNIVRKSSNIIYFNDGLNSYKFNVSKSTLYKKFSKNNIIVTSKCEIIDNPFDFLLEKATLANNTVKNEPQDISDYIILPLYSAKATGNYVPERSQLNQWNASGRQRNYNEVYVSLSAKTRKAVAGFLPPRDTKFTIRLPGGKKIKAKVCQDSGKALMSDPNSELGRWLLRDVLKLAEGELLTYDKLLEIGIDSIMLTKINNLEYKLDFKSVGSYEDFMSNRTT